MNERQAYLAIRNAIRLENLSNELAQKVAPQLRAIFNELGDQFRRLPPGELQRDIWYRQQRLRIADMLAPLSVEMRDQLTTALGVEVAQQMHYAESYLRIAGEDPMNLVAAAAPQDGISTSFYPPESTAGRVQFTRTQLNAIAQETRVMGERLEDLFEPTIGRGETGPWIRQNLNVIDRVVKAGFLTGQTNEQIAQQLPGGSREAIARNKAIARTAVMDLSANAQQAFWEANSDVIKGWEYDASMDNRVCPECAPWDGESRKQRSQLPATPLHVNCRCRVLPLTATELLLREEEGPQRRSVIELIEAPSKEEAIAKAKLKPGAVGARAYASQVRVKGKKYWRVAVDLERKDKPLTMGEFLKQASPATQSEVLGSNKRRGIFLRKITGDANTPPMSPERALKETVEWKPTVSRKPRMDAQLKLDISRLKSQKELMKQNSEGEQHIVYGYLRAKDSGTGKAGTPYYIGIGNSYTRAYKSHVRGRGRAHSVPVPRDEALVRQFGVFPTRAAAAKREQELIARYGRKGLDEGGVLLNRSTGGEAGSLGHVQSLKSKAARRNVQRKLNALGVSAEEWLRLPETTRKAFDAYHAKHPEIGLRDYLKGVRAVRSPQSPRPLSTAMRQREEEAAARVGLPVDAYRGLSKLDRGSLKQWLKLNPGENALTWLKKTPEQRDRERIAKVAESRLRIGAKKYGISFDIWRELSAAARKTVGKRFVRGKRGAALLEGLI